MENITQKDKNEILPSYIHMYDISGQNEITPHSFLRYQKDKEKNQSNVEDLAKENPILSKQGLPEFSSENDKISFINDGLSSGDIYAELLSAKLIESVIDEDDKKTLRIKLFEVVSKGLEGGNVESETDYSWLIEYVPVEKQEVLKEKIFSILEQAFETGDVTKTKERAHLISFASDKKLPIIIEKGFLNGDSDVRFFCLKQMDRLPDALEDKLKIEEMVETFIREGFASGDKERMKECVALNRFAPKEKQKELFEKAKEIFGNSLIESALYDKYDVSNEHFSRQEFEKTDSRLILIGGELKEKTVIRKISPESFLGWQKLFEDYTLWQSAGFDYVPVEPIQSFKVDSADETVEVYSGVLDLSYEWWKQISAGSFIEELEKDKDTILKCLAEKNIEHGHPHENNFCLRFFRDEKGNVDFNKKPRMYLIDFDQAKKID